MSLDEYRSFVQVVQDSSFTEAARSLGVSKSFVSKQVSRLEDRLGVQLLNRTTRAMTLTPDGEVFHERLSQILKDIDDAEARLTQAQDAPQGLIRVSVPLSFGLRHLMPVMAEFLAANPGVALHCEYTDRKVDLMVEGVDLALRIGVLPDSSLIARRLATINAYAFASPAYLAEHGTPASPAELSEHTCLLYSNISLGHAQTWTFDAEVGGSVTVRVKGRLLTNVGDVMCHSAVRGHGVAILPDFLGAPEVASGALQRILPEWSASTGALWAVFPQNRHVSGPVRALIDFLKAELKPDWAVQP